LQWLALTCVSKLSGQIGQIHVREVADIAAAKAKLEASFESLTQMAHDIQPRLLARGACLALLALAPMKVGSSPMLTI
jgi:hypothetical protein